MKKTEKKTFNSIEEIITDDYFIQFVKECLGEVRDSYKNRPEAPAGMRYKKGAYDQLQNEGNFNSSYFIKNISNIWMKKSSLNMLQRNLISNVCNFALKKTFLEYQKQYELKNKIKTKKNEN